MRVLVADDDRAIRESLERALELEGYEVTSVADGVQALTAARRMEPDIVLLDVMMPSVDGLGVCRVLRADGVRTPILMLTARVELTDRVAGLDAGADDYLAKPFKAKELIARIKTRLRHSPMVNHDIVRIGDLVIDVAGHTVRRNDNLTVSLTRIEFDLLLTLARGPQQVFSRTMLLEQVWHFRYPADTRLVSVHIQRLRSKIEPDPTHPEIVVTVRGIGYKAGEPTTAG